MGLLQQLSSLLPSCVTKSPESMVVTAVAVAAAVHVYHRHSSPPSKDTGEQRRLLARSRHELGLDEKPSDVSNRSKHIMNDRGMALHTQTWMPVNKEPKALILYAHGYGACTDWSGGWTCENLARHGFAVAGIDYEGHGRSDGPWVHIPNLNTIVADAGAHFTEVKRKFQRDYPNLNVFIVGTSMGGAVALLLNRQFPTLAAGTVFVAPMVKIHDDAKPHPLVTRSLMWLADLLPMAHLTPSKSLQHLLFSDEHVEAQIERSKANPLRYDRRHRLGTALELLRVCDHLESTLHEVEHPFLIVHGEADQVTDPAVSAALYQNASSTDKALKLYPGAPHALLTDPHSREAVLQDIAAWVVERSANGGAKQSKSKSSK